MKVFKSRKRKGFGMIPLLVILGVVAFASAVIVPKVMNNGNLGPAKEIQVQASTILNSAKQNIRSADLPALGLPANTVLTDDVFNSLKVDKVVDFLNTRGDLKNMSVENLTTSNPGLTLGNLKAIANAPTKDLIVDSTGNLTSYPYSKS